MSAINTIPFERLAPEESLVDISGAKLLGAREFARRFFGFRSFFLFSWLTRNPQPGSTLIRRFQESGLAEDETEARQILQALTSQDFVVDLPFMYSVRLFEVANSKKPEKSYALSCTDPEDRI